jgi:ubiquinone/menaquinone biosynthesis C-methylase UbiE
VKGPKVSAKLHKKNSCENKYPYLNIAYDSKRRFCGYWHQINEIISIKPKTILEIGIGSGFVASYLKNKGYNIFSIDILQDLNPDTVGSVLDLPFRDETFNSVSCCEVLEHLPYSEFNSALSELHRVSQRYVILSLPDNTSIYKFDIQLSRIMLVKKSFSNPFHKSQKHYFDGHHYWEIGKTNFSLEKIINEIRQAKFKIINSYRVFERPFQRFFILEPVKNLHGMTTSN